MRDTYYINKREQVSKAGVCGEIGVCYGGGPHPLLLMWKFDTPLDHHLDGHQRRFLLKIHVPLAHPHHLGIQGPQYQRPPVEGGPNPRCQMVPLRTHHAQFLCEFGQDAQPPRFAPWRHWSDAISVQGIASKYHVLEFNGTICVFDRVWQSQQSSKAS